MPKRACPASPTSLEADIRMLLHALDDALQSQVVPSYLDYVGPAADMLRSCCTVLRNSCSKINRTVNATFDFEHDTLKTLLALADEHINAVDFHLVAPCWLSLYTDACLLLALEMSWRQSVLDEAGRDKVSLFEAVRLLDMAIIIAGALGPGRVQWVRQAITSTQALLPDPIYTHLEHRPKRARAASEDAEEDLLFAPNPVPSVYAAPSIQQYIVHHSQRPFVIRDYFSASTECPPWPALSRWSDPEYLLSRVGEGRHVPVEVGSSYDDHQWTQRIVPFREFLREAGFFGRNLDANIETDGPPMYLAQHSLFLQFPELEEDVSLPDYVWSAPPVPPHFAEYSAPATHDGVIMNVWIGSGSRSIVSPAHTDPYYNCYAQVLGKKRVWLAPPSCSPYMSPHGQHGPARDAKADVRGLVSKYMDNTSTYPIFRKGHKSSTLMETSPSFSHDVWPHAMETVLEPGDLLVMPPRWWHAMTGEGEGPGWSVSMWY